MKTPGKRKIISSLDGFVLIHQVFIIF